MNILQSKRKIKNREFEINKEMVHFNSNQLQSPPPVRLEPFGQAKRLPPNINSFVSGQIFDRRYFTYLSKKYPQLRSLNLHLNSATILRQ
ncbi:unnamed protein product [Cunninghamella blakesleeana]